MRTCEDALDDIFNGFSQNTLVEKPCEVSRVIDQYTVDVKYFDNNVSKLLVNVPVKHLQTNSAFVFLPLKIGDYGTVRFFDNDVTEYYRGTEGTNDRTHDINDNVFSYGFYPSAKHYIFPDGDLVLGTKSGALINLTENTITINGGNVVIGENTTIDGVNFLAHTHSNGNQGNPTGGVIK